MEGCRGVGASNNNNGVQQLHAPHKPFLRRLYKQKMSALERFHRPIRTKRKMELSRGTTYNVRSTAIPSRLHKILPPLKITCTDATGNDRPLPFASTPPSPPSICVSYPRWHRIIITCTSTVGSSFLSGNTAVESPSSSSVFTVLTLGILLFARKINSPQA